MFGGGESRSEWTKDVLFVTWARRSLCYTVSGPVNLLFKPSNLFPRCCGTSAMYKMEGSSSLGSKRFFLLSHLGVFKALKGSGHSFIG
jgi:hypothetical protein